MIARQPPEIEIAEDVAEQDKASILCGFQKIDSVPGAAQFRAEMNIGENQRVKYLGHGHMMNIDRYMTMKI